MLDALYNTDILALASTLRHEQLHQPYASVRKVSKLCGSELEIDVHMNSGLVSACALRVKACALGQASAAILKANIIGARHDEIEQALAALKAMLKDKGEPPHGRFSDLKVLAGVAGYPARHQSTLLAFEAAAKATAS